MRILFLLTEGPDGLSRRIIDAQAGKHEVTVIDLSRGEVPYETVVDEIWRHDRVISW